MEQENKAVDVSMTINRTLAIGDKPKGTIEFFMDSILDTLESSLAQREKDISENSHFIWITREKIKSLKNAQSLTLTVRSFPEK